MPELNANMRPIDEQRAGLLALAWGRGDEVSFRATCADINADPHPEAEQGVVLAQAALNSRMAIATFPDDYDQVLQNFILHRAIADRPPAPDAQQ